MSYKKHPHYPLLFIIFIVFIIFLCLINYYKNANRKDINAAASQYVTAGFFNQNRLCKIDKCRLIFSDTNTAVLIVEGMEYKAPHKTTVLKLNMSKDKQGLWYVKKAEPYNDVSAGESAD